MPSRVFLDLDGTLTDARPGITRSIRHALTLLDRPAPPEEALTWCVGPPLLGSLTELLDGDARLAERALALYRERFAEVGLFENTVYPEIPAALAALRADGHRLYLATSKPLVFAERIVRHFGLERWFDGLFGAELDGTRSGKAELLAWAMARAGRDAPGVMVGDRSHDVAGARANGLAAIGVLWGYGGEAELTAAGAQRLIAAPSELPAAALSQLARSPA